MGASYHFGHTLKSGLNSRLSDFRKTLAFCIDSAGEFGAELVVLTGDLFRNSKPGTFEQDALWEELKRGYKKYNIQYLIAAGNHDMPSYCRKTISTVAHNINNNNYITAIDTIKCLDYPDDFSIVVVPFYNKVTEKMNSTEDVLSKIKNDLSVLKPNKKTLCVWHCISEGTTLGDSVGMEVDALNEPVIPLTLSKQYSISIFGHVHRHSIIAKGKQYVINLGSMEVNDFTDSDQDKFMALIDTANMKPKLVKLPVIKATTLNLKSFASILPDMEEMIKRESVEGKIVRIHIETNEDALRTYNEQLAKELIEKKLGAYKYMGATFKIKTSDDELAGVDVSSTLSASGSILSHIRTFLERHDKEMIDETISYVKGVLAQIETLKEED
jgi:exonuclease SbcD